MITDKNAVPGQRPPQEMESGDAKPTLDESRVRHLVWIIVISAIAEISIAVLYVIVYFLTGVLQMLGVAGLAMLGLACTGLSYWLARRRQLDAAGYLLLLTILIAYGSGDWFLTGGTVYLVVSSVLLVLFVGSIVLPRKWIVWLLTSGLILASIWLANQLVPASARYDVTQIALFNITTPGLTILITLAFLGQIVYTLRIGNIRTRLLITFVMMALLPAIIISGVATAGSVITGRERVLSQLEIATTLKESQIEAWVQDMRTDLNDVLVGQQLISLRRVLEPESVNPQAYQLAYSNVRGRFQQILDRSQRFEELFLLNSQGRVVLSSDPTQEGADHSDKIYAREGLLRGYITPPSYSPDLSQTTIVTVQPVEVLGQPIGVLAGRTSMDVLNEIMKDKTGLGDTGEAYLVSAKYEPITTIRSQEPNLTIRTFGAEQVVERKIEGNGADLYENYLAEPVVGAYRWLPQLQVALLAEQAQAEAFGTIYLTAELNIGVALIAALLAGLIALFVAQQISNPLAELARTATRIAAGELARPTAAKRQDEIGTLAQAFDSMTTQLRGLIGELEQRVADRTHDLEQRSVSLEAAAVVSSAATSILEVDRLIAQVVELIRERFDLHYAGLFLVDEVGGDAEGEWAVLQASAGRASEDTWILGHQLRVDEETMIGWSIANAQARTALEPAQDGSGTWAKAALPLRSRGQVLGALSVQHVRPIAFDQDTIVVLQTMADQIAVALDNARLFAESQEALEATRRAYGDMARQSWSDLLRARAGLGYRSGMRGVTRADYVWRPEAEQAVYTGQIVQTSPQPEDHERQALAIPIKIRGNVVIGVLDTYKPVDEGPWTRDEVTMLEAIANQLGATLESAQLFEDTQRRARDEQQLRTITARVRDAPDLDAVLQMAVQEMAQAMGVERVFVQLGTPPPLDPQIEK